MNIEFLNYFYQKKIKYIIYNNKKKKKKKKKKT